MISERIVIVSEYYPTNLRKLIKSSPPFFDINTIHGTSQILQIARQILSGLEYLNMHGITNRNLNLDNIMIDDEGTVKIFNYGTYHMTNGGKYVTFPIGSPKYFAPDIFFRNPRLGQLMHYCDTWALGLILVELVLSKELWVDLKLPELITKVTSFANLENALNRILEEEGCLDILQKLGPAVRTLLEECLITNPTKRPWPKQLLKDMRIFSQSKQLDQDILDNPFLEDNNSCKKTTTQTDPEITVDSTIILRTASESLAKFCRSSHLPFTINFSKSCSLEDEEETNYGDNQKLEQAVNGDAGHTTPQPAGSVSAKSNAVEKNNKSVLALSSLISSTDTSDLLKFRSLKEVYYLWQLAGGDVIAELKRQGLTRKKPAVLSLPL